PMTMANQFAGRFEGSESAVMFVDRLINWFYSPGRLTMSDPGFTGSFRVQRYRSTSDSLVFILVRL
ncbi:MAG: hypothetical protein EB065_10405, partial [Betaproteobacteria bacterium]|nr:hypothetical protein [Betaproteobacteria bacterium]